jgi:hypothetical protein
MHSADHLWKGLGQSDSIDFCFKESHIRTNVQDAMSYRVPY